SRTITVPLVRSGDPHRAKANPLDHKLWPHDRRRLVDDLWALGLANLPELQARDAEVADRVQLLGRDLEPWRMILAVALWLQEGHGVAGLFDRMQRLADCYQRERDDLEAADAVRVLVRALLRMVLPKRPEG